MKKKLYFEQIHPFVRFARFMEVNEQSEYSQTMSYDCRFFYTYNGSGIIHIDGKDYALSKSDFILFQGATPYYLVPEKGKSITYIAINFDYTYEHFNNNIPIPPERTELFDSKQLLEEINFIDLPVFDKTIFLKNYESIERELLEIVYEFRRKRQFCNGRNSALFKNVLTRTARQLSSANIPAGSGINDIIDYIHGHYTEKLSNGDIAKDFHFHPNYVNYLMKLHTGLSLHQYILKLRISKAIDLLESKNMTVGEISNIVGFKDLCHFSRCFKKITGRNPSDFKKY